MSYPRCRQHSTCSHSCSISSVCFLIVEADLESKPKRKTFSRARLTSGAPQRGACAEPCAMSKDTSGAITCQRYALSPYEPSQHLGIFSVIALGTQGRGAPVAPNLRHHMRLGRTREFRGVWLLTAALCPQAGPGRVAVIQYTESSLAAG